jgi:hypothetical protein
MVGTAERVTEGSAELDVGGIIICQFVRETNGCLVHCVGQRVLVEVVLNWTNALGTPNSSLSRGLSPSFAVSNS